MIRLLTALGFALALCASASAYPLVATPPAAPAVYTPPAGTAVANAAALKTELANGTASQNLILAAGTYDDASYFTSYNGDKLYCASLGACTFNTGLAIGGNATPSGGVVQGIAFNVSTLAKGLNGSVISIWGSGTGGKSTQILDTTINGQNVMYAGIEDRVMEGTDTRRVTIQNVQKWGILSDTNTTYVPTAQPKLYDIDVTQVSYPTPGAGGGTNEAGIWVGNNSDMQRVRSDKAAWMCMWLGNSITAGTYQDIICDDTTPTNSSKTHTRVGIYFEHAVKNITVNRFLAKPGLRWGARCEYFYSLTKGCESVTITNSSIASTCVGFYVDDGNTGTTATNTYFEGQRWAAIASYNPGSPANFTTLTGNTYVMGRHGVVYRTNVIGTRCGL